MLLAVILGGIDGTLLERSLDRAARKENSRLATVALITSFRTLTISDYVVRRSPRYVRDHMRTRSPGGYVRLF